MRELEALEGAFAPPALKSRLLPLHDTTRDALAFYLGRRCQKAGPCAFVFLSMKGRKLHPNTVRDVFRRVVRSRGIASGEELS